MCCFSHIYGIVFIYCSNYRPIFDGQNEILKKVFCLKCKVELSERNAKKHVDSVGHLTVNSSQKREQILVENEKFLKSNPDSGKIECVACNKSIDSDLNSLQKHVQSTLHSYIAEAFRKEVCSNSV